MSFEINCSNCGAPSSVSVGICPYCKKTFKNKKRKKDESPLISRIKADYKAGKVDNVISACKQMYATKEKMRENNNFLLIYLKALLEIDGPATLIRSIVSQLLINDPTNSEALDILYILEARDELSTEKNDPGEKKLKAIIQRSPNNAYAHFFLGAHLFWIDKDYMQATYYLEKAVKHRPNFLRAWGCLGALYKELENEVLSKRAFAKAAKIETNTRMKKFFRQQSK